MTHTSRDAKARRNAALGSLCLIQFVDVLGVTVVITALPSMLTDTGSTTSADGTLVATGYATLFGGLLIFGARVGDRVGHRRTILASLAIFATGALVTAIAVSPLMLTVGRCIQGAGAAAAIPSALTLLTALALDDRERARALAWWSAAGAAAGGSGFVVGGVIADLSSWRLIFWAMLGIALLQAIAVLLVIAPDESTGASRPLNPGASALLTAAVMLVVVGTTLLAEPARRVPGAILLAAAAVAAVMFAGVDRRSSAPLLPRPLLRLPQVRRGTTGAFLNTATTGSVATLVTLYLQDGLGRTPLVAAITLLPFSVLVIVGSGLAARLTVAHARERITAAGLGIVAIGLAGPLPDPRWAVAVGVGMGIAGLGLGLSSVATTSLGTDVDLAQRGTAAGIVNTSPQVGTAVGTACVLLLASATTGLPAIDRPAPIPAWAAGAVVAALGAAAFAVLRGVGTSRRAETATIIKRQRGRAGR